MKAIAGRYLVMAEAAASGESMKSGPRRASITSMPVMRGMREWSP
jgi:hypothetical protein